MRALATAGTTRLIGGHDGERAGPEHFATALTGLGEIDEIAIVALPDAAADPDPDRCRASADVLVAHVDSHRYRVAVIDPPADLTVAEVQVFRAGFDSSRAALYHPWIDTPADPTDPADATDGLGTRRRLPPSGFVAGIYARTDLERGVHAAPANAVVRGASGLASSIDDADQDVLNPVGINTIREFPGRGIRVWGARTLSADSEWKYVNVRRHLNFLEHSIERGLGWVVFEPNDEPLWRSVRGVVEDLLLAQWRTGALLGSKPEEAYFVRCDRSTMTQHDLDNGRLICLVGVAPMRPAEFVIFRIGQWTADART
jgi:phage tail sheath protein FI